jgi:hypothetical protein
MGDKDDGAIVVFFGNCSTVHPRMKRRVEFRRRHEQPESQRQHPRRAVKHQARFAIKMALVVLQGICNLAKTVPDATGL